MDCHSWCNLTCPVLEMQPLLSYTISVFIERYETLTVNNKRQKTYQAHSGHREL